MMGTERALWLHLKPRAVVIRKIRRNQHHPDFIETRYLATPTMEYRLLAGKNIPVYLSVSKNLSVDWPQYYLFGPLTATLSRKKAPRVANKSEESEQRILATEYVGCSGGY